MFASAFTVNWKRGKNDACAKDLLAVIRTCELQRLVDQLQLQAAELAGQRTAAIQRLGQVEASRLALYDRLQETGETARSERECLAEHVRSVENRALGDLDRARQESKVLQAQLASAMRRHTSIEAEMRGSIEKANSATAVAVQMADNLRGRCAALEEQVDKLQSLPAGSRGCAQAKPSDCWYWYTKDKLQAAA